MTYEFIYEYMYMKNIVKSYLNSCVPRFQMTPVLSLSHTGTAWQCVPLRLAVWGHLQAPAAA